MPPFPRKPPVVVINSHVARGAVGGRAAVFALERLGYPVVAVPTVMLPWHPGHGKGTRIVTDGERFPRLLADLAAPPWLRETGAVLSGYLGEAAQAKPVAALVAAVKAANPGALYLLDPVIGDAAGLYVPEPLAVAFRETLLRIADIVTPNRFELAFLSGSDPLDNAGLAAAARTLSVDEVVVTSAYAPAGETACLLVTGASVHMVRHKLFAKAPNGTGDLLAALYLAHRLVGEPSPQALKRAVSATYRMVAASAGADELPLAAAQELLVSPSAEVTLSRIE
jgi:pyridoxine kinase